MSEKHASTAVIISMILGFIGVVSIFILYVSGSMNHPPPIKYKNVPFPVEKVAEIGGVMLFDIHYCINETFTYSISQELVPTKVGDSYVIAGIVTALDIDKFRGYPGAYEEEVDGKKTGWVCREVIGAPKTIADYVEPNEYRMIFTGEVLNGRHAKYDTITYETQPFLAVDDL